MQTRSRHQAQASRMASRRGAGIGGSAALSDLPVPLLRFSMDVNALDYCRFLLVPLAPKDGTSGSSSKDQSDRALIALPNLIGSPEADFWSLSSRSRVHTAIGKQESNGPVLSTARAGIRRLLL
ncbi:uncharacterized protein EV420DRAFT_986483 [Desarmillaria tabescens]|uniref:Uncharacterized protein n=1 Tax=Armillaria tabescens TaxID=1929756 RepID=A0AA39JP46_ARMTA|nr:uncharacterized protein EV420DRAFT_986483 [Desarmillaria tabescens]KAK0444894.1 hypothetical protein EV420DRAFT_986483 [Desarmillaria tabescens]